MRVVLSALTFDPLGVVALDVDPAQVFGDIRRRMNRVATLDGGAVFNDFGYIEADRSIFLSWRVQSAAQEAAVARLVQLYARVRLATPRGLWLAALEQYSPGATESRLSLLVVEKLT
jgi:hypothetical protein